MAIDIIEGDDIVKDVTYNVTMSLVIPLHIMNYNSLCLKFIKSDIWYK